MKENLEDQDLLLVKGKVARCNHKQGKQGRNYQA